MEQCDGRGSEEIQVKVFCCLSACSPSRFSLTYSLASLLVLFGFYLRENSSMKWGMPHQVVVALRGRRTTVARLGSNVAASLQSLQCHPPTQRAPSLNPPKKENRRRPSLILSWKFSSLLGPGVTRKKEPRRPKNIGDYLSIVTCDFSLSTFIIIWREFFIPLSAAAPRASWVWWETNVRAISQN